MKPSLLSFSLVLTGLFSLIGCSGPTFRILDKPVVFDEERKKLSLEYLESRHGLQQAAPYITPRMVVLHWTGSQTAEQGFDTMNPALLPTRRQAIAGASALNVAAQFLVDRDGTIFRQLPDTAFARHVIGLNYCAIGVENVGSDDAPLTRAQLKANEALIRHLKKKYPIEYVIGHYEYKDFSGHELWKEADSTYRTMKTDPGKSFMRKIRKRTADLKLKGSPLPA
ncbi:N-acetylmuramoyl-L-alanine amidase [Rufibacter radiotolerans]|uniref:N-acetylmuramoyl-L-alanine amidase n=1 Tax=Rufibacter radiotolerans TaxID=1379910 RepID=A0A0H4VMJ1_9BACT|nr:peptidoglycan recognition family protein [Rufibacter radiotolerans]AKQ47080.1 N-acetylmuramoyl-L-alanine amidase [Rufibacter radiotolerans]